MTDQPSFTVCNVAPLRKMASGNVAFRGTLLHTPAQRPGSVDVLTDHLIVVDNNGTIVYLAESTPADNAVLESHGLTAADVTVLTEHQFLLPGFIDTHFHAPQYQYSGVGTDLPLIGDSGWLKSYAFPTEASFADGQHARKLYSRCVQQLLRLGTTTANYFTTIHVEGCKILADIVQQAGQRAVLGKVCMDQHCPDYYTEHQAAASIQGAREVAQHIQDLMCSRLTAAVIPRFIPTCSSELLHGLGALAADMGLHIHSHISESRDQVDFSKQLHPDHPHDAAIYAAAGLLTPKSIFAHGTQLTHDALMLMAEKGAAVAHCPLSNFYFGDGLFDACKALNMGVKVSLGTDVAGGYSPSMLEAMRMAVINSHALKSAVLMHQTWDKEQQQQQQGGVLAGNIALKAAVAAISNPAVAAAAAAHMLTWEDALWLATVGGAEALGLRDKVGCFAVGMEFDALLVDVGVQNSGFELLHEGDKATDPLIMLESFSNNGDDRNIVRVYVQGRRCV